MKLSLEFLERGAAKDVWDTTHIKESADDVLKSVLFRARFIAMSAVLDHPLPSYGRSRLEGLVTDRIAVERLGPMLALSSVPPAKELIEKAWMVVDSFLNLDPLEEEYIKAIYEGELKTERLFPDALEEAARFKGHPAILWKLANVRKNLKRPMGTP